MSETVVAAALPISVRRAPRLQVTLVVACLFGTIGCRSERHEECRAFVYAVNTRLQEIDRVAARGSAERNVNPADMRRLADLYEQLAEKTRGVSIRSRDLEALRERYGRMVLDAARLARAIADSLESKKLEEAMRAQEQFTAVVSREDELVGQVNAFCKQAE